MERLIGGALAAEMKNLPKKGGLDATRSMMTSSFPLGAGFSTVPYRPVAGRIVEPVLFPSS